MRIFASLVLALGATLALVAPVAAATPTSGAVRLYAPGTGLGYRFAGTYPSWLQAGVQTALGPDWSSPAYNNSRLPTFAYSAGGSGTITFSSSPTSPCGTGNTQWLQCASNGGSSAWRIYVRNFSGAPYSNWTWCNQSFSGACWDIERAVLHEAEHVTMSIGGHDRQGESYTLMGPVSPVYASSGWNTHHLQRCDEAAGQLLHGMASPNGPLADCFNEVSGHGTVGLIPSLTATTTSMSVCLSQPATFSGSFGIALNGSYQVLSGQLLGGRTIWFDRKPRTSSVWTLNVASAFSTTAATNWSRAFSSGSVSTIAYDFRPHTSSETGLDATTGPTISVTWRSGC